jgi:hypothetical protein
MNYVHAGGSPNCTAGATKIGVKTPFRRSTKPMSQTTPVGALRIADLIARNSEAYFVQREAVLEKQSAGVTQADAPSVLQDLG